MNRNAAYKGAAGGSGTCRSHPGKNANGTVGNAGGLAGHCPLPRKPPCGLHHGDGHTGRWRLFSLLRRLARPLRLRGGEGPWEASNRPGKGNRTLNRPYDSALVAVLNQVSAAPPVTARRTARTSVA